MAEQAGRTRRRAVVRGVEGDHAAPAPGALSGRLVTGLLCVALVAACTDGEQPRDGQDAASRDEASSLLLDAEQVPGSTAAQDLPELDRPPFCSTLSGTERSLQRDADGRSAARRFTVVSGSGDVVVETAVFELRSTSAADAALSAVRTFSGDCTAVDPATPLGNAQGNGTFTALPGLPEGAVGYRLVLGGTDLTGEQVRAYSVVGRRVVVVGARADGPPVDVALPDLLAAAVQRVADAGTPS